MVTYSKAPSFCIIYNHNKTSVSLGVMSECAAARRFIRGGVVVTEAVLGTAWYLVLAAWYLVLAAEADSL